jgi:hypothetical protein
MGILAGFRSFELVQSRVAALAKNVYMLIIFMMLLG